MKHAFYRLKKNFFPLLQIMTAHNNILYLLKALFFKLKYLKLKSTWHNFCIQYEVEIKVHLKKCISKCSSDIYSDYPSPHNSAVLT